MPMEPGVFDEKAAAQFLRVARRLIEEGANESAIRHNLSAFLPQMFTDNPWWIQAHARGSEERSSFDRAGRATTGFVDTLVGSTVIEYEKDIGKAQLFDHGLGQVKDYCASLLNKGVPRDRIVGVLSDTVRWHAYRIGELRRRGASGSVFGRDHLVLENIESCDLWHPAQTDAGRLRLFLTRHLGRQGARPLDALTLSSDLGFNSDFSRPHRQAIKNMIDSAFARRANYAALIERLWKSFVSYLGGESPDGDFNRSVYVDELYVLTLAKLICANVLSARALASEDEDLRAILNGEFFQNRGLSNLVEYDYFGWLNRSPEVDALLPSAKAIQSDLLAYDFAQAPAEDLFGTLLAELARRSQRLLLGQEWTPRWLAEKVVGNVLNKLPADQEPRFIDMCCGSGALIVETVRQVKKRLEDQGVDASHQAALHRLSDAITGFDIDPLAVMLAKIGWVLAARDWLRPDIPAQIPVYHADSLFNETPLKRIAGDGEAPHYAMLLDDREVDMPAFLVRPQQRQLFDALMERAYRSAMVLAGESDEERAAADTSLRKLAQRQVADALSASSAALRPDRKTRLVAFVETLIEALEDLQRKGRNGIWAFVLRNSYRPALLAGRFNGIVSNPPWLALSKIASNPYKDALTQKSIDYGIKSPGSAHLHTEMATIFLLHAVSSYLETDAVVGCILPESILNAYHHNPFRSGSYASAPRPVALRVDEIWRIEKGAFKNEAVSLFATRAAPAQGNIPGRLVGRTGESALTFSWLVQGGRTAWSDNPSLGAGRSGFFNPAPFREGADCMPRSLVFHRMHRCGRAWNVSPIAKSSPERYLTAKLKKHKNFSLTASTVSDRVVYRVLLSNHLAPFELAQGAWGILPIKRAPNGGPWQPMSQRDIALAGASTGNVMRRILGELGPDETLGTYFNRINTDRKKLVNQQWGNGWLVFMGAGGGIVCAAYANTARYPMSQVVIDQTLYWAEVDTEDEAIYLTALLNSVSINVVIGDFQPRGQQGRRHVHKLPFGVTPPYDPSDRSHLDVVRTTRQMLAEWSACKSADANAHQLLDPNHSALPRRRSQIRALIQGLSAYPAYEDACKTVYAIP